VKAPSGLVPGGAFLWVLVPPPVAAAAGCDRLRRRRALEGPERPFGPYRSLRQRLQAAAFRSNKYRYVHQAYL